MQSNVSQFVIVGPQGQGEAVREASDRIEAHLRQRFPGYHFQIEETGPFANPDVFTIIPIMGCVGGDDGGMMFSHPSRTLLAEIAREVNAFDVGVRALN